MMQSDSGIRVLIPAVLILLLVPNAATAACVNSDNEFAVRLGFVLHWAGKSCNGIRALSDREWDAWFAKTTRIPDALLAPGARCHLEVLKISMDVGRETAHESHKWCGVALSAIRLSPWLKARMLRR